MRGRLTRIEKDIAKLEGKETLGPSDKRKLKRLLDQVKDDDREFEERHLEVLNYIKEDDQDALDAEEEIYDAHGSRVMEIIDRLEQLEVVEESVTLPSVPSADPSQSLTKRLRYLEREKQLIVESSREIVSEPESHKRLRLQKRQEDISSLSTQLSGLVGEILSLTERDTDSLMETAASIKSDLSNLDFEVRRLLLDFEDSHRPSEASSKVRLPKISIPTFNGKILCWKGFWEQFDATIHSNPGLSDADKLTYLQDALKEGPARFVIDGLTRTSDSYEEAIRCLKERYDRPRYVLEEHIRSIVDAAPVKNGSEKEIRRLCDAATQHYRALKAAKADSFETLLTVILQQKLDEKTRLKWAEFNSESDNVPPCTEILKFLDLHARQLESVSHTGHKQTSGSDRKVSVKQSYATSTDDTCLACKKRGHQIHTCSVFKGWLYSDRISFVRKSGLCINCLRKGHIAENCRAPPMCKKCTRKHHTLLHRDVDSVPQEKHKDDKVEETHVAALTVSEQVLLMTCKVKVTAADGSSTLARALIDPGSSASYVHERLAQHLRLPRKNKNVIVEGVAGRSTRTRGSVWFQVSGVEDDSEKVGVEAYVLKKITKDLPLEPIPTALKWDHLSDLKLADPDFRTPARIDLLLGAEVFTSILRDGRRTGPRGTPSALNTCFGWVLFGKIERDVVDVANHTVEQLVCIDVSERRRSYAAVLIAGKNKDLRCTGRRKKQMDEGRPQISRREIPENRRIRHQKIRQNQDLARCEKRRVYTPKTLGNQGVSAGGMLAPERHLMNVRVSRRT